MLVALTAGICMQITAADCQRSDSAPTSSRQQPDSATTRRLTSVNKLVGVIRNNLEPVVCGGGGADVRMSVARDVPRAPRA